MRSRGQCRNRQAGSSGMSGQLQEWLDPGAEVIIYALSVPVFSEQGDTRGLDTRSVQGTQGAWMPGQRRGQEGPGHQVSTGDTRRLDTRSAQGT